MYHFSAASLKNLEGVHPSLVKLFTSVIQDHDCTICGGGRTIEQQRVNVLKKLSRTMDSKHLKQPDGYYHALDACPYPMPDNWDSARGQMELTFFAGKVVERARALGIVIRYGGDWNSNDLIADNGFMDLDHFEVANVG